VNSVIDGRKSTFEAWMKMVFNTRVEIIEKKSFNGKLQANG
jgi:hypothetical protein